MRLLPLLTSVYKIVVCVVRCSQGRCWHLPAATACACDVECCTEGVTQSQRELHRVLHHMLASRVLTACAICTRTHDSTLGTHPCCHTAACVLVSGCWLASWHVLIAGEQHSLGIAARVYTTGPASCCPRFGSSLVGGIASTLASSGSRREPWPSWHVAYRLRQCIHACTGVDITV